MATGNSGAGWEPTKDVDLALRVGTYLESLPAHRSATASEIAEALQGSAFTLDQVVEIYWICQELRQARILIPGRDGYGYQIDLPAPQGGGDMTQQGNKLHCAPRRRRRGCHK